VNSRSFTLLAGLLLINSIANAAQTIPPVTSVAQLEAIKADTPIVTA
jgi:hypothetical protein